jgi:hypothetical protein
VVSFVLLLIRDEGSAGVVYLVGAVGTVLLAVVVVRVFAMSQESSFETRVLNHDPGLRYLLRIPRAPATDKAIQPLLFPGHVIEAFETTVALGIDEKGLAVWHLHRAPERAGYLEWSAVAAIADAGGELRIDLAPSAIAADRSVRLPVARAFETTEQMSLHTIETHTAIQRVAEMAEED